MCVSVHVCVYAWCVCVHVCVLRMCAYAELCATCVCAVCVCIRVQIRERDKTITRFQLCTYTLQCRVGLWMCIYVMLKHQEVANLW